MTKGGSLTLAIVVVIGVLGVIMIRPGGSSEEAAYLEAMKSDLRELLTAQDTHFANNQAYTFTPSGYSTTMEVTELVVVLTEDGWTARVGHNMTTKTCAIFIGSTYISPTTSDDEGEPKCTT